jgi:hypothetical protein
VPLRLLRFLLGLVAGLALWMYATPAYDELLAAMTEPLLRVDARFRDADLVAVDTRMHVRSQRGNFPLAIIPASQLTFNTILLTALFASNAAPLGRRNLRAFLLSLLIVLALHPLGLVISIESTYALRLEEYSETHYGDFARNFWLVAEMFWRLVGMFGIAFACWYMTSGETTKAAKSH